MDIKKFIRPHLLSINTYEAVDAPELLAEKAGILKEDIIKLNGNENPFGPSPKVINAIKNSKLHIYPDPLQYRARAALSEYSGAPLESIIVGAGADELIDLIFRLFISPGDIIVDFEPTFGMYSFCAEIAGANVFYISRDSDFNIDLDFVKRNIPKEAKLLFLTSPNNPTGNTITEDQVKFLLDLGLIVVIDEAYYEFSGNNSMTHLIEHYDNLIILRTMSKWAGLAGLRVGYGLMNPKIVDYIMQIKPPYSVSNAAEEALLASLEDKAYLLTNVNKIIRERNNLFDKLKNMPYVTPYPSNANFILIEFDKNKPMNVYEQLCMKGIFVRRYNSDRLRDCLRVSIGTPEEMSAFTYALTEIIG